MHDPEKSDSGIVATKPTNEAGRLAEEPAEPRPGTKGNADQQSTHRTQSRVRVTQALDRVREAARRRKKGQFTALLHHINADTLRTAFYALKRKAAPGVDGVTWHDYEADLEPRIEALQSGSTGELTDRNRRAGRTYRRPTGSSGRSRSPPWKTRSSRAQPSWRSTLSTKATSAVSRTGSDPGEGRTMRWTRYRRRSKYGK